MAHRCLIWFDEATKNWLQPMEHRSRCHFWIIGECLKLGKFSECEYLPKWHLLGITWNICQIYQMLLSLVSSMIWNFWWMQVWQVFNKTLASVFSLAGHWKYQKSPFWQMRVVAKTGQYWHLQHLRTSGLPDLKHWPSFYHILTSPKYLSFTLLVKLDQIRQRPFWEKCSSSCPICASNQWVWQIVRKWLLLIYYTILSSSTVLIPAQAGLVISCCSWTYSRLRGMVEYSLLWLHKTDGF